MDDLDVRWVASQSPIPALQALIREAERENKSRPSTSLSAPPDLLPPCASDPAPPTRPSAAHRTPAVSAHAPPHVSARSHHATAPPTTYVPQEEEPEAVAFVELLRDAFKKLDENALHKQRLAARAREKDRELLAKSHTGSHRPSARHLTKTSSASAICPAGPSTSAPQLAFSTSMSSLEPRGRVLAKTASLGPGVATTSGKSPASLPNHHTLNCDPKLASRLPARSSTMPNAPPTTARSANTREPTSADGDSPMQDVIDLTETDTESERPISIPMTRADTTLYMRVDDEDDSDGGMDMSFFQPERPPPTRIPAPKPKLQPPQPNTAPRPIAPTQRTRAGPPPLGMRRAPLVQPSQYSSSQGTKGVTVPRFKPPLLTNARGGANKDASGTSSRPPPRGGAAKVAVVPKAAQESQDADSSFDVSFDMDVDALEEAMKAYD